MQEQRAHGLVLRSVDYGEADRIITFLTEEFGKVAMFARAARKSVKRFGGALEPFQTLELRFRERRPGALASLAAAQVLERRPNLIKDYARIMHASYLTELVGETVPEREPMAELFYALGAAYDVLDTEAYGAASDTVRGGWIAAFELKILTLVGYRPLLEGCATCGSTDDERFRFQSERGGLVCEACARRQGLPFSFGVAQRLRSTLRSKISQLELDFSEQDATEARRALGDFIRYHLGKELRSARFVDV